MNMVQFVTASEFQRQKINTFGSKLAELVGFLTEYHPEEMGMVLTKLTEAGQWYQSIILQIKDPEPKPEEDKKPESEVAH